MSGALRFVDWFAGIGGFRLGLEAAGHRCVWSCEIDPFARRVYEERFGHAQEAPDVNKVRPEDIPEADLWVGGFPCQDLSSAGQRKGLRRGTRSGLVWKILDLAKVVRPQWLLMENVPGLLSSKGGKDFGALIAALDEIGFVGAWRLLDARHHRVPQRRRRVFILARRAGPGPDPREVLLEPKGGCWDPPPRYEEREEASAAARDGAEGDRGQGGWRWSGLRSPVSGRLILAPDFSTPLGTPSRGAGHRCDPFDGGGALVVDGIFNSTASGVRGSDGWNQEVSPALKVGSGKGIPSPPAIVYRVNAAQSCAKKDHAKETDYARCLDTTGGFAAGQGGTIVAHPAAHPVLYADDVANTLDAEGGHRFRSDGASDNIVVAAQCHGGDVGKMGTLRAGRGDVQSGVPFIAGGMVAAQCQGGNVGPMGALRCGKNEAGGVPFIAGAKIGVRRLTPLECERLQGFPDGWTDLEGATDAQRYKATGNAVAVPVIFWLGRRIARASSGRRGLIGRIAATGRAARRTLALLIAREAGSRIPQIPVEEFRTECIGLGIYDAPNFVQDMTKDAALFKPIFGKGGVRLGWSLTKTGRREAALLPQEVAPQPVSDLSETAKGATSGRDARRRIALRLLLSEPVGGLLEVDAFREACKRLGVYDRANFAQDMTKDARLFDSVRDESGRRVGWRLTEAGRAAAAEASGVA